jgi:hypothetical protein
MSDTDDTSALNTANTPLPPISSGDWKRELDKAGEERRAAASGPPDLTASSGGQRCG